MKYAEICRNLQKCMYVYKTTKFAEMYINKQTLTKFAEMYINKYTNVDEICRNVYKQLYKR